MSSSESNDCPTDSPSTGRDCVLAALFSALGIITPMLFHAIPHAGPTLLPMHLPILIVGCLVSPGMAAVAGLITPGLSWAITGMPAFPFGAIIAVELAVLGASAAVFRRLRWPIWLVVPAAVLCRAVATLLLGLTLGPRLGLPPAATGLAAVAAGLPGVLLQWVTVPPVVARMDRRRART